MVLCCLALLLFSRAVPCQAAITSVNIPLDSPVYLYLEKLSGFGLITSDIKGIKPFSKAEAARLTLEAEKNLACRKGDAAPFAADLILRLRAMLPREILLRTDPPAEAKTFDYNLLSAARLRGVWLDGAPRSYERLVKETGDDGVFGIGSGLRPSSTSVWAQHGSEGTPLAENNNGIVYRQGFNGDLRWAAEGYLGGISAALVEPTLLVENDGLRTDINRGYLKLGGGGLELEAGRDESWLGLGYRGAITQTNNAKNFDLVKLSSPEPLDVAWVKRYLGEVKYSMSASQFNKVTTLGGERQPWFYALKLSLKPIDDLEIGFNLGRQVGGPGVDNSFTSTMSGLIGGKMADNSNGLAGIEAALPHPLAAQHRGLRRVLRRGYGRLLADRGELRGRLLHPAPDRRRPQRLPFRVLPGTSDPVHQWHLPGGLHLQEHAGGPFPGRGHPGLLFPGQPLVRRPQQPGAGVFLHQPRHDRPHAGPGHRAQACRARLLVTAAARATSTPGSATASSGSPTRTWWAAWTAPTSW